MTTDPSSPKPARIPEDYGVTVTPDTMLTWSFVEERLQKALNYWVATIGPSGRPHVRPVDGVWVEGALIFGGSPETRWVRNLKANPHISVNLGSEEEAIILEGAAELVTDPDHPLAKPSVAASMAKYPQYYPDGKMPDFLPFWLLHPDRVYAWTLAGFATNPTRWDFNR
jgi:general stress protein 26